MDDRRNRFRELCSYGGPLHRLSVVAPSTPAPGQPFRVIVEAQNKMGFTVRSFEGEVHLSARGGVLLGLPPLVTFRREDHGVVHVEASVDEGDRPVRIVARAEGRIMGVSNPILPRSDAGQALCWGDIHAHVREFPSQAFISEEERLMGPATVDEAYTFARDVVGLDFCGITDHDSHMTDLDWERRLESARAFHAPGGFVTFAAYEWSHVPGCMSCNFGHRNVIYLEDRDVPLFRCCEQNAETAPKLWQRLEEYRAGRDSVMVIPHHPARAMGNLWHNWDYFNGELERNVEVFSLWGSSEKYGEPYPIRYGTGGYWGATEARGHHVQDALRRGYRFGFVAGSESHDGRPGRPILHGWHVCGGDVVWQGGLAAVWADGLTRQDIWDGLWGRRCYGTTGVRIILEFSVNGQPMGSEVSLEKADEPRRIEVAVHGTDVVSRVDVVKNNVDVHSAEGAAESLAFLWVDGRAASPGDYYYVRVTQRDGQMAWSSPVWMDLD